MKKAAPAKKPAQAAKGPAKTGAGKAAPAKKPAQAPKKEEEKKVEEVPEKPPAQESVPAEPEQIVEQPKEPVLGSCVVNFNHYNSKFPITDGVMKWFDIDEEYAFSCVYEKGFFLKMYEGKALETKGPEIQVKGHTFLGCEDGKEYVCEPIDAPDDPNAFRDGEEAEEEKVEEEVDLPVEDDNDPGMSPQHPKNLIF